MDFRITQNPETLNPKDPSMKTDPKKDEKNEQHMENAGMVRALATACKIKYPAPLQQQFRDSLCNLLLTHAKDLAVVHVQRAHDALCDLDRRSDCEAALLTAMQFRLGDHFGLRKFRATGKAVAR